MKNLTNVALSLVSACILGCTALPRHEVYSDTSTLAGLQNLANVRTLSNTGMPSNKVRETALKETALGLGAQSGLASEADHINLSLVQQARVLDTVYDFNSLLLEANILPPVLLEGQRILNLADPQTIRLADRTYKVSKQARFVTTAPTWRQYLWMDYQKPEVPNVTLLPKNKTERALWRFYIEKGWKKGQEQASTILQENIAHIKEDFGGMILYRKLLAMNMISAPFVSHTDLGITGDASEIHIDDQILRITALPSLNVNSQEWKAAVESEKPLLAKLEALERDAQNNEIALAKEGWHPVITPVN